MSENFVNVTLEFSSAHSHSCYRYIVVFSATDDILTMSAPTVILNPNDGYGDRSGLVKAISAAFLAVTVIVVSLRCYVRLQLVQAFGWDDGIMVFALV